MAADCATSQRLVLLPDGEFAPGAQSLISFGHASQPARLRATAGGSGGLLLDVRQWFVTVEDHGSGRPSSWRAETTAYEYRILDREQTELLVFHWQPGSRFRGPDFPHLHISASLSAQVSATVTQRLSLDKRHVPTGHVTLADVVRMLIAEFGIAERRRDWPARLARAERAIRRRYPSPDPADHE